ncbi:MAG TPA: hypothetical protein VGF97_06255 [Rhizomicrobium sp.]|jgi:hypothetical protein
MRRCARKPGQALAARSRTRGRCRAGADTRIKTPEGKTAGDFARERGHEAIAERLV